MSLIKKAIYRGFATQTIAWGFFFLIDNEYLRWMVQPGFTVSKLAGDSFALAAILAFNWLLCTTIWMVLLVAAYTVIPGWDRSPARVRFDPARGYHEASNW